MENSCQLKRFPIYYTKTEYFVNGCEEMKDKMSKMPYIIFGILTLYLALQYLFIYLIDIRNVFGWQQGLIDEGEAPVPLLWYVLNQDAFLTEIIAWTFLIVAMLMTGIIAGIMLANKNIYTKPFLLLAGGFTLMILEDVANIRHMLRTVITLPLGYAAMEGYNSAIGIVIEFVVYILLASLMVYPVYKLLPFILKHKNIRNSLLVGYAFYGLAAFLSASRHISNWYGRAGEAIINHFDLYSIQTWAIARDYFEAHERTLGFHLIDYLFEETLEIIASAFLAIAMIYIFVILKKQNYKIEKG